MLFHSYIFIFLFLPLTVAGWFLFNKIKQEKLAQGYLLGMSLWFYAYLNISYLWMLLGSCLISYLLCGLFDKCSAKGTKKAVLAAGCFFHLGALGYFKYSNFFLENVNALFQTHFPLPEILLPLGISFYTFQQLAFLIDRYRGETKQCSLLDYLTFMAYFPQVLQGPILLSEELIPQLHDPKRRRFHSARFAAGIQHFVIGLSKKVLLADTLAKLVDFGYTNVAMLDSLSAVFLAVGYMFELYFDFSGYCDMAVGMGKMIGIEIPENFDAPFSSLSVKEFWRRWHMTLGRFFTRYVYIPLGGSRRGTARAVCNTMIVFALSGLWHGASWGFVLWGVLHGLGVAWSAVWRAIKYAVPKRADSVVAKSQLRTKRTETAGAKSGAVQQYFLPKWLRRLVTFSYVTLAFVFFRAATIKEGFAVLRAMFQPEWNGFLFRMAEAMELSELYIFTKAVSMKAPGLLPWFSLALMLLVFAVSIFVLGRKQTRLLAERTQFSRGYVFGTAFLLVWSLLSLNGVASYIYFSF